MHNISEDSVQNYFSNYSTGTLGWGKFEIYQNVAHDLPPSLKDERETMHLNFNSPLDSLLPERTYIKYSRSKYNHQLNLRLTVGGLV